MLELLNQPAATLAPLSLPVTPRDWQLRLHDAAQEPGWLSGFKLICATPGAGKTTATGLLLAQPLHDGRFDRVFVVCNSRALREQWARALDPFGIYLDPRWDGTYRIPTDRHGAVITYQALTASMAHIVCAQAGARTAVVLDEIHHAGEERAWAEGLRTAFGRTDFQLALSGTPFRSDGRAIPFVNYGPDDVAVPDFSYTYSEAVADGVCRPVVFQLRSGTVEWLRTADAEDEPEVFSAHFDDELNDRESAERLRAALSPEHDHVRQLLIDADVELTKLRMQAPDTGALAICVDNQHAEQVAAVIERLTGEKPTIVTSRQDQPARKLREYSRGTGRWLVAVKMVSEGVDIPRLGVLALVTNARTELSFRQAVGRVLRVRRDETPARSAAVFMLKDPAFARLAREMEDELTPGLRAQAPQASNVQRLDTGRRAPGVVTIDAVTEDAGMVFGGVMYSSDKIAAARQLLGATSQEATPENLQVVLSVLAVQEAQQTQQLGAAGPQSELPAFERVALLRAQLNVLVKGRLVPLVQRVRGGNDKLFAEVFRDVNREMRVRTVAAASEAQLRRGIEYVERRLRTVEKSYPDIYAAVRDERLAAGAWALPTAA